MSLSWTNANSVENRRIVLNSASQNPFFNAIQINPGSFRKNFDNISNLINGLNIHAICISETWFDKSNTDKKFAINGFTLIRNDRKIKKNPDDPHDQRTKRGGGVAIYLKSSFKYKIVKSSRANSHAEFLFIEVLLGADKLMLGVVYIPPPVKTSSVDALGKHFSQLTENYELILIGGDFNIDLLKDSLCTKKFKKVLSESGLNCESKFPTNFVDNCDPSQIDLFLSKSNRHF